jgi:hypothetical protein
VHISSVVAASLKLLGFLFRSWNEFRSEKCLTTLYFSLVRSRLEYGSVIWCPYYVTYTNSSEFVQRKFLKYLSLRKTELIRPLVLIMISCVPGLILPPSKLDGYLIR